jgi:hypothetical protein
MSASLLAAIKAKASSLGMTYTDWITELVEESLGITEHSSNELASELANRIDTLENQCAELANRLAVLESPSSTKAIQKLAVEIDEHTPTAPGEFSLTGNDACAIAQCNGSSLREACRKAQSRGENIASVKGVSFEFKKIGNQWWYRQVEGEI